VIDVLLPAALALIMFALGLTLAPDDFRRVLARPKAMAAGLIGQLALVPALGWAVATAWGLPGEMAVGLMIVAACPGGASSGLITYLARGDTALSISLTAVSSIAAALTMPLIVTQSLQHFLGTGTSAEFPVLRLSRGVFFLTTVPVMLGMAVKYFRPILTERLVKGAERLATSLFLGIVVATFASQREVFAEFIAVVGPAATSLNLMVMVLGFALAAGLGLTLRDRIAIAIECGLHNAAVGIYLAATVLASPRLAVPSVIYALLMNISAITFIVLMRRRSAPTPAG
jgi:BASS family bile acid:Na+ symporter